MSDRTFINPTYQRSHFYQSNLQAIAPYQSNLQAIALYPSNL
jgi:hypothetical protein